MFQDLKSDLKLDESVLGKAHSHDVLGLIPQRRCFAKVVGSVFPLLEGVHREVDTFRMTPYETRRNGAYAEWHLFYGRTHIAGGPYGYAPNSLTNTSPFQ